VSRAASATWTAHERADDLAAAEREGVDVLVVGGGITGAGVLRDAALRGLRALLVERDDFGAGTSSRSSKLVHGGLRYIAEGQLRTTHEACAERDRLLRLDPSLVRPVPFLFPAHAGGRVPLWQVRVALGVYAALASFRRTARFRMLRPDDVRRLCAVLRSDGLRGAGLYTDARVDDARLVLETLRSARAHGGLAASYAEVESLLRGEHGVAGARVRDRASGNVRVVRAGVVVNATGTAVERIRRMGPAPGARIVRPAKGVHLVVPQLRLPLGVAVTFEAADGRNVFAVPWDDVVLLGTTDEFSDELDEPVVTIEEVHYLLAAANHAFPDTALTTNDLCSVFAGVRPLAADPAAQRPSSVSRDDRIDRDDNLISVSGGKLTTYRAMAERVVDHALQSLPRERARAAGPCRTRSVALRPDAPDAEGAVRLEAALVERFGVSALQARHLVTQYGAQAEALLAAAPAEGHQVIGRSRFSYAEIGWALVHDCCTSMCDLLERRVRMALFAPGQGLSELPRIAEAAAAVAGWDAERARDEARAYADAVRRRYQIAATAPRSASRSAA
jgi:glycerol-3-phosphate dehydrogenase